MDCRPTDNSFKEDGFDKEQSIEEVDISIENNDPKEKSKLELKIGECLDAFYELMNSLAEELNLKNSHFNVSHGMHHENNFSSAADIAKLSCHAMTH